MAALARSRDEALGALGRALAAEAPLRTVITLILDRTIAIYQAGDVGQRGCFLIGTAVT